MVDEEEEERAAVMLSTIIIVESFQIDCGGCTICCAAESQLWVVAELCQKVQ